MRALGLFAGAGGAALGTEAAGVEHLALVEWDHDACNTLRAAGLGPVVEGDVRDLDAVARVVGGAPVDLLKAGFPCQGFSTAGKRLGARDERNGWPWTVAAIDRFRPTWFIGENVRGLTLHKRAARCEQGRRPAPLDCPGCYFDHGILGDLRERFAHVQWRVLDAADYGVPQHRRRVIIIAGPRPVEWPEGTHGPTAGRPWVSMGEALGLTGPRLDAPAPTVTTTEVKGTRGAAIGGRTASGAQRGGVDRASDALWLATGRRRLTVEECALLQGFPADHPWQGTKASRYRQVGNAVPPKLAEVVVRAVLRADGGAK